MSPVFTAMLTAGMIQEVSGTFDLGPVNGASGLVPNLEHGIINGVSRAVVSSAIDGTPLESSLQTYLTRGVLLSLGASGANLIGDQAQAGNLDGATHILAHAIAGCAIGAAMPGSGGKGCDAGQWRQRLRCRSVG